ncbi:MAG: hypothetical protein QME16_00065 [Planctomycetota bacterium]|nr:hypothetical protein [Planctomycetota bacterium]
MKKLILFFLLFLSTLSYAQPIPGRLTIEEEDGAPSGAYWKLKVTNGTLTENADYSGSVTTGGGGGVGDVTSVGDCTTGACFDGTQGTTLTFNNVGGDKTLDYDGTDFLFNAPLSIDATDPADAEAIRLDNAEGIAWEASPAGTDVTLKVDASEILQASGTFNAAALTEGAIAVYNDDEMDTYSEINAIVADVTLTHNGLIDTSSELAGILTDETGTGAAVFGTSPSFTTSVAIPNGASPVVDAAGEIAQDTTDDQLLYGATPRVLPYYAPIAIIINSPTASGDGAAIRMPYAVTIKAVHALCVGGTNWVGHLDECDANGGTCAGVDGATDITSTAGTNANDDGTLSNPTIDSGDYIGVHTTSVSGTPTRVIITFDYTVDRT